MEKSSYYFCVLKYHRLLGCPYADEAMGVVFSSFDGNTTPFSDEAIVKMFIILEFNKDFY